MLHTTKRASTGYSLYRVIEKSRNPLLAHVTFIKKNTNYIKITQKSYIKCLKCPLRSAMHGSTLSLVFDVTR